MISGAPWYVSNQTVHEDLKIPFIQDTIKSNINKHKNHKNVIFKLFSFALITGNYLAGQSTVVQWTNYNFVIPGKYLFVEP
jgi:hypothetical protein